MRIFKFSFAAALWLATVSNVNAKKNIMRNSQTDNDRVVVENNRPGSYLQTCTPTDANAEENRYIVVYKDTPTFQASMFKERTRSKNVIQVLPKDNCEVIMLDSIEEIQSWEERDDVEYVERGKDLSVIFCDTSNQSCPLTYLVILSSVRSQGLSTAVFWRGGSIWNQSS